MAPSKLTGTMAFMFESALIPRVCHWALESPFLDHDYYQCWIGLKSHFSRISLDKKNVEPTEKEPRALE